MINERGMEFKEVPEGTLRKLREGVYKLRHPRGRVHHTLKQLATEVAVGNENKEYRKSLEATMEKLETVNKGVRWNFKSEWFTTGFIYKLPGIHFSGIRNSEKMSFGLMLLCWASYWRRVWIIQEFVLAKDYVILCGNCAITKERFENALEMWMANSIQASSQQDVLLIRLLEWQRSQTINSSAAQVIT